MLKFRFSILLALAAVLHSYEAAFAAYPQNYLSDKLGAEVSAAAKLTAPFEPNALLSDGPISKGRFAFAPVEQSRTCTVDLGRPRTFDRIQLGTSGNATSVAVEASSQGSDGPFMKVCETDHPVHLQTLWLPLTTARWLRFDFGLGSDRIGVHSVRIYKGYEHPGLADVTGLLGERVKPELPGLKHFRSNVAAGNWAGACSELRAFFAAAHKPEAPPNPACDLSRANEFIAGNLNFAGLRRTDPPPIDWAWMKTTDWYEHKNFFTALVNNFP